MILPFLTDVSSFLVLELVFAISKLIKLQRRNVTSKHDLDHAKAIKFLAGRESEREKKSDRK